MRSVFYPDVSATTFAPFHSLALGVHTWTVRNDEECHKGTVQIKLTLSDCSKETDPDEFTCDNGLCVLLEKRCDGIPDCYVSIKQMNMQTFNSKSWLTLI